jgi:hypothetical protein
MNLISFKTKLFQCRREQYINPNDALGIVDQQDYEILSSVYGLFLIERIVSYFEIQWE